MPRRTKEEAEQTRQLLLDTALQLFSEQGIARTSFKDIAARSGLTHGALYWHFKNRGDLVAALYQESRLPLDDLFLDQLQSARQDALGSLGDFMEQWCRRIMEEERPRQIWRVFHQSADRDPELQALLPEIQAEHEEWLALLGKIIKKARKQKQIAELSGKRSDPLPRAALAAVMGVFASLQYPAAASFKPKAHIRQVVQGFLYGLGSR